MHLRHFSLFAILALFSISAQAGTTVENIRIWAEGGKTRVVLDLSRPSQHNIFTLRNPDRLVVDLEQGRLASSLAADLPESTGAVRAVGHTDQRLKEAAKLGFSRAVVPAGHRLQAKELPAEGLPGAADGITRPGEAAAQAGAAEIADVLINEIPDAAVPQTVKGIGLSPVDLVP